MKKPPIKTLADLYDKDNSVGKNSWWIAKCVKHGDQPHLMVLDGRCMECQKEGLLKKQ